MLKLTLAAALLLASSSQATPKFSLKSSEIQAGAKIGVDQVFNSFGCTGKNVSPSLSWEGAPEGTQSFALTMYDPDAPTGSGWWHWVVVNIPASTKTIPAGAGSTSPEGLPAGALQVRTDFGSAGYGGPCPPAGSKPHRYQFTLHALKVPNLELPDGATSARAGFAILGNSLGKATLEAKFSR